jgi:hypothetical protein
MSRTKPIDPQHVPTILSSEPQRCATNAPKSKHNTVKVFHKLVFRVLKQKLVAQASNLRIVQSEIGCETIEFTRRIRATGHQGLGKTEGVL